MSAAPLGILLFIGAGIVCFVLFTVFVLVPVFKGIGWLVASFFGAVFWVLNHIVEFIGGMISDTVRFVGAIIPMLILSILTVANVVVGRWSASGHYADSVKRECAVAGACLYRVFLRRPLKLFWLHGLLEGVEERIPEAMYAAPGSDRPSKRTGQFDGYTIVGSLAGGGSGGKLYIARPDEHKQHRLIGHPDHVVIKSFALTEGSSLPQIVRESRALEAAKQLGHVLDHGMDDHRFFYVMPYHPGDHLGIITRQLHGETDGRGLAPKQLTRAAGYVRDLVATLTHYHNGGLWHKDVKPENIIVHDGRAHLVDLGLVTPLKSAMTLTTHGTEYFRDPEMVRQALRGVKVHQVNGAKFDIYAAGAVLYFILENTFPAHGGLSRFAMKSPEALRWIVRRAMTEYNQRYESAEVMLADVEYVLSVDDPFAIKPAELPSMSGKPVPESVAEPSPESKPGPEPAFAAMPAALAGRPEFRAHTPIPPRRPRLRVTNWWTGEYAIDDGSGHGPGAQGPFGPKSFAEARRTAREQIASARARAREMRERARAHRHKVGIERQPSAAVVMLSLAVLGFVAFILFLSALHSKKLNEQAVRGSIEFMNDVHENSRRVAELYTGKVPGLNSVPTPAPELAWLLINDHPSKADPRVQGEVQNRIQQYSQAGWTLIANDLEAEADIRRLLPPRAEQLEMTPLLAAALANRELGGILYIDARPASGEGDQAPHERIRVRKIAALEPEFAGSN